MPQIIFLITQNVYTARILFHYAKHARLSINVNNARILHLSIKGSALYVIWLLQIVCSAQTASVAQNAWVITYLTQIAIVFYAHFRDWEQIKITKLFVKNVFWITTVSFV